MKSFVIENKATLLLLVLTVLIFDMFFYWHTLEDAQITFRYSLRFYEGYPFGMWNRTGEPVEGFTTIVWMLYLSLFGANLEMMAHASKITSILFHQAIVVFFLFLFFAHRNNRVAVDVFVDKKQLAAVAFRGVAIGAAIFIPMAWYATTGMETLLFAAIFSFCVFLPLVTTSLVAILIVNLLAVFVRPEGFLFSLVATGFYLGFTRDRKFFFVLVVSGLAFALLMVFRKIYFGHLLPNTYYAKSENPIPHLHYVHGVEYFLTFLSSYFLLFVPVAVFVFKLIRKKEIQAIRGDVFIFCAIFGMFFYFLLIAKSGGDNFSAFPMWRHVLHIFPLILFCCFYSIKSLKREWKYAQTVLIGYIFLTPVLFTIPEKPAAFLRDQIYKSVENGFSLRPYSKGAEFFVWMRNTFGKDALIATSLAGALPLHVDANHIDILGLNDVHIAHYGHFDSKGPVDSKTDMDYVVSRRPDVIEGYMSASKVLRGDYIRAFLRREKMNVDLVSNPEFQAHYLIVTNAPYQHFDRILFIRKDFLMKEFKQGEIETAELTGLIGALNDVGNEYLAKHRRWTAVMQWEGHCVPSAWTPFSFNSVCFRRPTGPSSCNTCACFAVPVSV